MTKQLLAILLMGMFVPSIILAELTKKNPIEIDKAKNSITFLAKVNGKFLKKPTRHAVVFAKGSNGNKSIFKSFASHVQFYNTLKEIKAVPGDNMTLKNKEKTHVKGSDLKVTVSWENSGKEFDINEVITDSNDLPIVLRFGGNGVRAFKKKTGCLICLDSCPVGIVSNAVYSYGAVEKRGEVQFIGNELTLPEHDTLVQITVSLKTL
jgi:hypothetical protein